MLNQNFLKLKINSLESVANGLLNKALELDNINNDDKKMEIMDKLEKAHNDIFDVIENLNDLIDNL